MFYVREAMLNGFLTKPVQGHKSRFFKRMSFTDVCTRTCESIRTTTLVWLEGHSAPSSHRTQMAKGRFTNQTDISIAHFL